MKKNIINANKPTISDNEILQSKPSFNSLYSKFITTPAKAILTKGMLYWASGMIVAVTTATILILQTTKNNTPDKSALTKSDSLKTTSCVEEPLAEIAIPYSECTFNAEKGSKITTSRGSNIVVPKDAFVYEDGTPVDGNVNFKYREFNNPIEIFQSGIPMRYDSANTEYIFESAGMIELLAFKDNKELSLAKGKTIDVELKSNNNEDRFNVYYLDTTKRNWIYQGRDICEKEPESTPQLKVADTKRNNIVENQITSEAKSFSTDTVKQKKKLIKPALASKKAPVFKVDYNTTDFPELSAYQNILFELTDKSVTFNKEWYSVNWDKISLKHTKHKDLYLVTLQKKDSLVKFIARPVFDNAQYDQAMKVFNQNQRSEPKPITKREPSLLSATSLSNSFASSLADDNTTSRSFKVSNMGYWNCDQPVPFSNFNIIANASFKDANSGRTLDCKTIYIATLQINMLLKWSSSQLGYSKTNDNICFVVTYDERIGIVNPTDFKNAVTAKRTDFKTTIYSPTDGIRELSNWIENGI